MIIVNRIMNKKIKKFKMMINIIKILNYKLNKTNKMNKVLIWKVKIQHNNKKLNTIVNKINQYMANSYVKWL
jgi:hypothetical protein